ncbi:ANK_REP_REGION domain-containing protein [Trichonephila clavipes]|nr:ANK_REP_REGION domain-containing protein [Trichonephila clavipes]
MKGYHTASTNLTELWTPLANIWQVIPVERFQKLIESMPRLVAAIIKARGGPTPYWQKYEKQILPFLQYLNAIVKFQEYSKPTAPEKDTIKHGHTKTAIKETNERIYDVHRAVMRDQLEHVVILLENKKLALARDQLGATPLHKAVWFGHYKIAHFISQQFPETLNAIDLVCSNFFNYTLL